MKSGLPRDGQPRWGLPGAPYHKSLGWSWLNRGLGFLEKREKDGDVRIIVVEKGSFMSVVGETVSLVCGRREEAMICP